MKRNIILIILSAALIMTGSCDKNRKLPVPDLKIESQGSSLFTISWKPVKHAGGYGYSLDGLGDLKTTDCTVTFEGLKPGTYKAYVRTIAGKGYRDSEITEIAVTLTEVENQATITVIGTTSTSIEVLFGGGKDVVEIEYALLPWKNHSRKLAMFEEGTLLSSKTAPTGRVSIPCESAGPFIIAARGITALGEIGKTYTAYAIASEKSR